MTDASDFWFDADSDPRDGELALELSREDQQLIVRLIQERNRLGLTQEGLAERLGISQATVSSFEKLGNDARMSTIRRYARGVGLVIRHHVDSFDDCHESEFLTHVTSSGASSHETAAARARVLPDWPAVTRQPVRVKATAEGVQEIASAER